MSTKVRKKNHLQELEDELTAVEAEDQKDPHRLFVRCAFVAMEASRHRHNDMASQEAALIEACYRKALDLAKSYCWRFGVEMLGEAGFDDPAEWAFPDE